MLSKIIISIIFIPLNALLLWTVNELTTEHQSYNKALIAASLIFFISLLLYIPTSSHSNWIMYFIRSWHFRIILSGLVLWIMYRYDWKSLFFIWVIWAILQIPFNILQTKILNLPWDMLLQAF